MGKGNLMQALMEAAALRIRDVTGSATHLVSQWHLQACVKAEMRSIRGQEALSHFSNSEAVKGLKKYLQWM